MDHMGPQFQTVYRGLNTPSLRGSRDLGMHWSTDKSVAEGFASFDEEGYAVPGGTLIEAKVHRRNVVQPGSLERAHLRNSHGVHGGQSAEYEAPVRPGAVVHVRNVESLSEDGSSTSWSPENIRKTFGSRQTGRA